jgi:ubiquitin carboxyl-terminal hydrolase 10
LPWLSVPDADFPARAAGRRRRKRGLVPAQEQGLALPSRGQDVQEDVKATDETTAGELESAGEPEESQASTTAVPSDAEVDTPSTSHPPSEIDAASVHQLAAQTTAPAQKHTRNATKPAVPLIPIKQAKAVSAASVTQKSVTSPSAEKPQSKPINEVAASASEAANVEEAPKPTAPAAPKSWAELLRAKNAAAAPQAQSQAQPPVISNGIANTNGPAPPKSNSLSDVLASYSVEAEKKVAFIEPRGLVNTGNLCYMNSVSFGSSRDFLSSTNVQ